MFDKAFEILANFAYLFRFIAIVNPYEQAVLLRMGRLSRVLLPGWHLIFPFKVDTTFYEIVVQRTNKLPISVTTGDGVQVAAVVLVTWEVSDVAKLVLGSADHQVAPLDVAAGIAAEAIRGVHWSDLGDREFAATLKTDIKKELRKWGIRAKGVKLTDLVRTRTIRVLSPQPVALPHA